MFVTPVGALGALAHQPTGFLREDHLRSSLRGLMQEFYDAALANGVELPVDTVDKTMAFVDTQPADSTSSMQRDIRDGLPNELDAQVGGGAPYGGTRGSSDPAERYGARRSGRPDHRAGLANPGTPCRGECPPLGRSRDAFD